MTCESTRRGYGSNENLDRFSPQEDNAPKNVQPDESSFITLLCDSLVILWKDWPRNMKLNLLGGGAGAFSFSGECPHCGDRSVFLSVAGFAEAVSGGKYLHAAVMRCQGCQKFILGVAESIGGQNTTYVEHYPLGKPDDSVDENVPTPIAEDFSEALRCLWVRSHKAAVAMCRRSVEAACKDLGAKGKDLYSKIEDLAEQDVITDPMRRMAHQVRLTANRKLHEKPKLEKETESKEDADDLDNMAERDAQRMITFTKEFFHHVYAIRALLEFYEKPEGETPAIT
jgi:hypothetical protein